MREGMREDEGDGDERMRERERNEARNEKRKGNYILFLDEFHPYTNWKGGERIGE